MLNLKDIILQLTELKKDFFELQFININEFKQKSEEYLSVEEISIEFDNLKEKFFMEFEYPSISMINLKDKLNQIIYELNSYLEENEDEEDDEDLEEFEEDEEIENLEEKEKIKEDVILYFNQLFFNYFKLKILNLEECKNNLKRIYEENYYHYFLRSVSVEDEKEISYLFNELISFNENQDLNLLIKMEYFINVLKNSEFCCNE